MSERFMAAYSSFKQAMQTGAFLQLLLTLLAIVCRLHALTWALVEVHEELATTLLHLCTSLEESTILKQINQQPSESDGAFVPPASPVTPTTGPLKDGHYRPDQKQAIEVREPVALAIGTKKRINSTKPDVDKSTKPAGQSESAIDRKSSTLRTKKKKFTDEIDAIFGF
ncbi:hypothetical protein P691DRAFT_411458 [Macrolepiota fuliginosa MF-IS2]|uniref:Uncharacterized protein n=1 Tax=Macrolepiota fuliginosa MF-IS2 TaxID=1400762 RepID=A0A9P5XK76_9AGAR|nr:hypothetical protein P691DRAFT_411458 [Macrolepiota fuliginosa MF-IS2]